MVTHFTFWDLKLTEKKGIWKPTKSQLCKLWFVAYPTKSQKWQSKTGRASYWSDVAKWTTRPSRRLRTHILKSHEHPSPYSPSTNTPNISNFSLGRRHNGPWQHALTFSERSQRTHNDISDGTKLEVEPKIINRGKPRWNRRSRHGGLRGPDSLLQEAKGKNIRG